MSAKIQGTSWADSYMQKPSWNRIPKFWDILKSCVTGENLKPDNKMRSSRSGHFWKCCTAWIEGRLRVSVLLNRKTRSMSDHLSSHLTKPPIFFVPRSCLKNKLCVKRVRNHFCDRAIKQWGNQSHSSVNLDIRQFFNTQYKIKMERPNFYFDLIF